MADADRAALVAVRATLTALADFDPAVGRDAQLLACQLVHERRATRRVEHRAPQRSAWRASARLLHGVANPHAERLLRRDRAQVEGLVHPLSRSCLWED